jgi:hypothetical protein
MKNLMKFMVARARVVCTRVICLTLVEVEGRANSIFPISFNESRRNSKKKSKRHCNPTDNIHSQAFKIPIATL